MNIFRTSLGLAALVGLGVIAAPHTAQAAGTWQWVDANGNGYTEIAAIDRDGNGLLDEVWIDTNEDGKWDVTAYDYDRNSSFEWVRAWSNVDSIQGWVYTGAYSYTFIDRDGNGRFESHYFDGNRDGHAEYLMVDTNGDGHADTWSPVFTPTPSVSTSTKKAENDLMVAHIVRMNQMHFYGL